MPCVPVDCLIYLAKARGHVSVAKMTSVVIESRCFAMHVCLRPLFKKITLLGQCPLDLPQKLHHIEETAL